MSVLWLGSRSMPPPQPQPVRELQLPAPQPVCPWRARVHIGSHTSFYTHISSGSRTMRNLSIYFLEGFVGTCTLFKTRVTFPTELSWGGRIRSNLSSSFLGVFYPLLLILHPYITVTEYTLALRSQVQAVRFPIRLVSFQTLPPNGREEQLRRLVWVSANIAIWQPCLSRRTFYQYWYWLVSWILSEGRQIWNSL